MTRTLETVLRLKAAGEGLTFTGWASTPDQDREGDIVDPAGAVFETPVPLLWQHDHRQPIGVVREAHATSAGLRVAGKLTSGVPRASEAWALMQDGALALSVGFRPLESEPLRGGGQRFKRWEWLELSLVSVPANGRARLSIGKGLVLSEAPPSRPAHVTQPAHPAPVTRQQQPIATSFDAELFGEAVGDLVLDALAPLWKCVRALEAGRAGAERGVVYRGTWNRESAYVPGNVVFHAGANHAAIRAASPGGTPPNESDSGWVQIT